MLAEKKAELAKAARECHMADLMEDLGLDYEEADEIVKEYEAPERLAELLFQTTKVFYNEEFNKREQQCQE